MPLNVIVVTYLFLQTNAFILNPDQIKALKLARPFLGSDSAQQPLKSAKGVFHRNQERKLSLVESNQDSMDMAKESIVTDALNVSALTAGQFQRGPGERRKGPKADDGNGKQRRHDRRAKSYHESQVTARFPSGPAE